MLYVKIMADQDIPDTNPWKHYTIVPVENDQVMEFVDDVIEDPGVYAGTEQPEPKHQHALLVHSPDGSKETHPLTGNAYVMNEHGKTIASHGC